MAEASHPFQRLQSGLAALIAMTPSGERLPSEPDLARKLGVSRATLREAMRTFEGQGLIRRKQGVGTFVVGPTQVIESGLEILESIETLAERIELQVSLGDLLVKEIDADEMEATALSVETGAHLIHVSRVIQTENRPVAYLVDILPEDVLTAADLQGSFTGSVLDLLLKRGNPPLSQSYTEIRAVAASTEVSRALEIQRGDVLLMFIASLYSTNGKVIDHSYSYFLPGYFRFHVVRSVGLMRTQNWAMPEQERRPSN
jgi:GntR family transcriptional regulator